MKNLFRALAILLCALSALWLGAGSARAQSNDLPPAMVGPTWYLVSIANADTPTINVTSGRLTIHFTAESMNADGGCAGFGGEYTTGPNNAISFSQIISSMLACPDSNVTQLEGVYKRAIATVSSYKLSGNQLQLIFNNGQGTLTYVNSLSAAQNSAPAASPTSSSPGQPAPTQADAPTSVAATPTAGVSPTSSIPGMPVTGGGDNFPLWPVALGLLIVVLGATLWVRSNAQAHRSQ